MFLQRSVYEIAKSNSKGIVSEAPDRFKMSAASEVGFKLKPC